MKHLLKRYKTTTKVVFACLLIASPWFIVQLGIFILAPDDPINDMPSCTENSGNCAHLGGGDDYRLIEKYASLIDIPAEKTYQNLLIYIEDSQGKVLVKESSEGGYFVHFVEVTSFWNFPDDVIVSIQSSDNNSIIEIHSESRLGWGDIGLNSERIATIYTKLSRTD